MQSPGTPGNRSQEDITALANIMTVIATVSFAGAFPAALVHAQAPPISSHIQTRIWEK